MPWPPVHYFALQQFHAMAPVYVNSKKKDYGSSASPVIGLVKI
jgi:hypothetical protein